MGTSRRVFSECAPRAFYSQAIREFHEVSNYPDRNDWAPRFGFAWDPKGDGKMSVRGGFGVFYDILKGEDNLQFNGQPPFFAFADFYFDPLSGNPTSAR